MHIFTVVYLNGSPAMPCSVIGNVANHVYLWPPTALAGGSNWFSKECITECKSVQRVCFLALKTIKNLPAVGTGWVSNSAIKIWKHMNLKKRKLQKSVSDLFRRYCRHFNIETYHKIAMERFFFFTHIGLDTRRHVTSETNRHSLLCGHRLLRT